MRQKSHQEKRRLTASYLFLSLFLFLFLVAADRSASRRSLARSKQQAARAACSQAS